MKLQTDELQQFYKTVNNAVNVVKDDSGKVISFDYMKYYGKTRKTGKLIKVSLKSSKEQKKQAAKHLDEKQFFERLADNIEAVTKVKLHCDKIYRYELNGQKYKTFKSDTKKLFDFLPYTDFLKVTRQRFWNNDEMLRSGYFSGLLGTNYDNILKYNYNRKDYRLYDVDFNSAYAYCFKMPLPFGKFYTADEWQTVEKDFISYMKFYQIKLKSRANSFKEFIPVEPYAEYKDFDFLLQKNTSHMIVTQQRLDLINKVYGADTYIIKQIYYCGTKIYLKLADFTQKIYNDRLKAKELNDTQTANDLRVALSTLVGNFGRRDESKGIDGLRLIDNDIFKDVIAVEWTAAEYKQQNNYLPLAMTINDITAIRLFDLLNDENVIRLCYNTDGGIVAVKKGCRVVTSARFGRLKAERIYNAEFFYTTMLYARPLILDRLTGKVYNSKAIYYDSADDNFIYSENLRVNCREGFFIHNQKYKIVAEPYFNFNLRKNEILLRLTNNDLYKRLRKKADNDIDAQILAAAGRELDRLLNPYDSGINDEIRRAPVEELPTLQLIFLEKFFKNT